MCIRDRNKVAVVTGSGADMFKKAKRSGADVLITGDMKYHDAQDALDIGMNVIEDVYKRQFLTNLYLKDIIVGYFIINNKWLPKDKKLFKSLKDCLLYTSRCV